MKRLLLILSLICIFTLVGCSEETQPPSQNDNSTKSAATTNDNSNDSSENWDGWNTSQDVANFNMMMSVVNN